jgi:hypothetical protein
VRTGGGWNWLRSVSNGEFGIIDFEPSGSDSGVLDDSKMGHRAVGHQPVGCRDPQFDKPSLRE